MIVSNLLLPSSQFEIALLNIALHNFLFLGPRQDWLFWSLPASLVHRFDRPPPVFDGELFGFPPSAGGDGGVSSSSVSSSSSGGELSSSSTGATTSDGLGSTASSLTSSSTASSCPILRRRWALLLSTTSRSTSLRMPVTDDESDSNGSGSAMAFVVAMARAKMRLAMNFMLDIGCGRFCFSCVCLCLDFMNPFCIISVFLFFFISCATLPVGNMIARRVQDDREIFFGLSHSLRNCDAPHCIQRASDRNLQCYRRHTNCVSPRGNFEHRYISAMDRCSRSYKNLASVVQLNQSETHVHSFVCLLVCLFAFASCPVL